jgi:serine/threonine protein kinase
MSFIANNVSEKQSTWNEWHRCSVLLDTDPPATVVGLHFEYEILSTINYNGLPGCTPRSYSFRGRILGCSEGTLVFIKFMDADSIDIEWTATAAIPYSPHLNRPFDRSPPKPIDTGSPDSAPDQFHFIVSELIDGDDLYNICMNAPCGLPRSFLIDVFCQMVNVLAILQASGIVHCDIKPENIMWNKTKGILVIIDFEHSVHAGEGQEGGTKDYQAPEVAWGMSAHYSRDVYSFGVSFLTLWGGEKLSFIDNELMNWPTDLGADLKLLLSVMIHWNPEERPAPEAICELLANLSD